MTFALEIIHVSNYVDLVQTASKHIDWYFHVYTTSIKFITLQISVRVSYRFLNLFSKLMVRVQKPRQSLAIT